MSSMILSSCLLPMQIHFVSSTLIILSLGFLRLKRGLNIREEKTIINFFLIEKVKTTYGLTVS